MAQSREGRARVRHDGVLREGRRDGLGEPAGRRPCHPAAGAGCVHVRTRIGACADICTDLGLVLLILVRTLSLRGYHWLEPSIIIIIIIIIGYHWLEPSRWERFEQCAVLACMPGRFLSAVLRQLRPMCACVCAHAGAQATTLPGSMP